MSIINAARLKQYALLEYNVLLIGLHGVGKTSVVKKIFTELYGDKWRYFSASTLDPWVDFVGVPDINRDSVGKKTLELIRPSWCDDEIEAIFLDEFNRTSDKVINAVMELIQFKTINGHRISSLKIVWAAINPEDEDDTYSVNHLDPAQLDRFQVHMPIPYQIDADYFDGKYPNTGPIFRQWWKDLGGDIQRLVSPRRLDYAADAHAKGCPLKDFLPTEANAAELITLLKSLPFHSLIKKVKTDEEALAFIKDINNSTKLLDLAKANDSAAVDFFTKYGKMMPKELTAPVAEFVHARKNGFEVVASVEELISRLPDEKGNQGTAALINNAQLNLLYKNGGNLTNDLRALNVSQPNLITKLTNRCWDIICNCQTTTLERIFWGMEGKDASRKTNFQEITSILGTLGKFSHSQKTYINNKLYSRKIVDDMNYL